MELKAKILTSLIICFTGIVSAGDYTCNTFVSSSINKQGGIEVILEFVNDRSFEWKVIRNNYTRLRIIKIHIAEDAINVQPSFRSDNSDTGSLSHESLRERMLKKYRRNFPLAVEPVEMKLLFHHIAQRELRLESIHLEK